MHLSINGAKLCTTVARHTKFCMTTDHKHTYKFYIKLFLCT